MLVLAISIPLIPVVLFFQVWLANMSARFIAISHSEYNQVLRYSRALQQKQACRNSRDQQRQDLGPFRFHQYVVGKLGEVGAAKLVKGTVDFDIWPSGRGADQFEPDIQSPQAGFEGFQLHVKTCNLQHGRLIGNTFKPSATSSWTIDVNDPVFKAPTRKDILMLMFASESGAVYSLGWVYAAQAHPLWRPCRSPHMQHKRALYLADVQNILKRAV